MRILLLGNNWVAWQVVEWLKNKHENIVGLVVHPKNKQKYGQEIINSSLVDERYVFDGSCLRNDKNLNLISELKPDIALSVLFGYILKPQFINIFPQGVINLHLSLLPYNRGSHPNVWSIVEQTPAGVTLHYIDSGIDTGNIIAQKKVPVTAFDTGKTLYHKLEKTCILLFEEWWPKIKTGNIQSYPQTLEKGTYHSTKDVAEIDLIELDANYKARNLLNIIRSRTFPPYKGAYFLHEGRKVYMRLHLYEDDVDE